MRLRSCNSSRFLRALVICAFSAGTAFGQPLYEQGAPALPSAAQVSTVPSFAELAKALSPAVVNITVEGGTGTADSPADASKPDQQKEAPPKDQDPANPFRSSGSGFILNPDGYIVTSNHVIDRSDQIIVRLLNDKTEYKAKVVGKDKKTDIALLKIAAPKKLPVAYLGDSDAIEVGEWALAIGNQFELGQTVTAGILSAKARRVPSRDTGPFDQYIQTDASINPGSSGGPLFNTKGQVIGVNTAIFTPGRGGVGFNIGIGFAIPINLVKEVVTQLKEKGKVTRSMLGVIVQPIDSSMAEALGLSSSGGALVAEVLKESPAARAGFQQRDVVVAYDGHPIDEYEDLPMLVSRTAVGKAVSVEILRGGQRKTLEVSVEEQKEIKSTAEKKSTPPDALGLRVDTVPDEFRKVFKLGANDGVIVVSVEPNSRAELAGLVPGDVILELNSQKVSGIDSYKKISEAMPKEKAVLLLVQKKDGTRFLALKGR